MTPNNIYICVPEDADVTKQTKVQTNMFHFSLG